MQAHFPHLVLYSCHMHYISTCYRPQNMAFALNAPVFKRNEEEKAVFYIYLHIFPFHAPYYFLKICDFIWDHFASSLRPSFGFSCSVRPTGNPFSQFSFILNFVFPLILGAYFHRIWVLWDSGLTGITTPTTIIILMAFQHEDVPLSSGLPYFSGEVSTLYKLE